MTKNKAIIPSMDSSSKNLTEPTDIIEYVLRHYFSAPKNINDTHRPGEISLRYDEAESGHDEVALAKAAERNLIMNLDKYFSEADSLSVNVASTDLGDNEFELSIDVIVTIDGTPYAIDNTVKVDSSGNLQFSL